MSERIQIPEGYQRSIRRAVEILTEYGCTEVYLFGSLTTGNVHERSDIDLAVRGCPDNRFFRALGQLLRELDYPVDLVDLDDGDLFSRYLEREGELVQIA